MFEFKQSALKKEKEEISEEQKILKGNLKELKYQLKVASYYRECKRQTIKNFIRTVVLLGLTVLGGICTREYYLLGIEDKFFLFTKVSTAIMGILSSVMIGCTIGLAKSLIYTVKSNGRIYNKNKKYYKEKSKELEEKINLCDKKTKDIDVELSHIQFYNENSQKPVYQADTKEEYEFLISVQGNLDVYLEEYLKLPIDYENIHLETNQYDENIHRDGGKTLVKTYNQN